jgi:hypothetical protein
MDRSVIIVTKSRGIIAIAIAIAIAIDSFFEKPWRRYRIDQQ